jgi:hypothetical protein
MKWSELSTEECNRLVAERVMELHIGPCSGSDEFKEWDESYITCLNCKASIHVADGEWEHIKHGNTPIPDYANDMNAALLILDSTRFFASMLHHYTKDKRWLCTLSRSVADDPYQVSEFGKTAPDAICLAALKACGVDIEP